MDDYKGQCPSCGMDNFEVSEKMTCPDCGCVFTEKEVLSDGEYGQ